LLNAQTLADELLFRRQVQAALLDL
jgi:hypothetical protein